MLGCIGFIAFGAVFWTQLNWAAGIVPKLDETLTEMRATPSVILSDDGKVLFEAQEEYREPIASLSDVPKHVIETTLAAEDRRFYDHIGVDWWGAGRALLTNVREMRAAQGASTITMQLAKRLYTSPERSFNRKIKDMALAVQIEQKLPKDEILRLYLNQVFYGSGAYGIGAAAETYFGKDLKDLTLSEAALLARVVRRPSDENPWADLEKAIENRNVVLRTMLEDGKISQSEYDEAVAEKPKLRPRRFASGSHIRRSPYFVRYVIDSLKKELPGVDLTQGGYRIETTLDAELDDIAQNAVRSVVKKYRRQKLTTGAFVLMDDEGRILAMAGGYDYDRNEYNVIYQGRRQPGSAFKPFVYAAALSTGALGPNDSILNQPLTIETTPGHYKKWPKGKATGPVSVKRALASSYNPAAARVCEMVTPQVAAQYARDVFGFRSPIDPVLSLVLGSSAVSPLEMAQAYSVFMNYGDRAKPFGIKRVIGPDGRVIKEFEPEIQRNVLDPSVCASMDEFLRAVVTGGTATKARAVPDARGKTGTTSDNRDAWFCGYTNNLIGIGWVGNEQLVNGKWVYPPMQSSAFGGTITVDIWTIVMKEAVKKRGSKQSRRPEGLKPLSSISAEPMPEEPPVDDVTGGEPPEPKPDPSPPEELPLDPEVPRLPDGTRPGTAPETPRPAERPPRGEDPVVPGTERPRPPRTPETRNVSVEICAETGLLANRYCPETVTRRLPRADAPKDHCTLHGPGR